MAALNVAASILRSECCASARAPIEPYIVPNRLLFKVWVYYSAQIFLIGAEFTWVYAHKLGSRKGVDPAAVRTTSTA